MKHRFVLLALPAGLLLATASCDTLLEPANHVYDGPPLVEFAPVLPAGTYTRAVTFPAGSQEIQAVTVRVNYIGARPAGAVSGDFTLADGTTAVEGTHFTVSGGKQFTIPAGGNSTDVAIDLDGGALEDGQAVMLVLELVPGDGFGVSENYKRFTITAGKEGT